MDQGSVGSPCRLAFSILFGSFTIKPLFVERIEAMSQPAGRFVAILGDPACRPGWQANFIRLTDNLWEGFGPSHVFVAGDVVMTGTAGEHEAFQSICRRYPWKWHVAMGDHDRPLSVFQKYWGPPHTVTDLGRWQVIGVDTSEKRFTKNEEKWLRRQIKKMALIYMHMPPGLQGWAFHSLGIACTARFLDLLDDFREQIRACFFGHIHSHDEKEYNGIPLILTGAGGADARSLGTNGYEGAGRFQSMVFGTETGEILLFGEDAAELN